MMSASQMSAAIRAKKKKMSDEAVKLSGIPMDATDIDVLKRSEATDGMNENHSMDRDEEPSLEAVRAKEMAPEPHEEMAPDPHEINEDEKKQKMDKIRASIMRSRK